MPKQPFCPNIIQTMDILMACPVCVKRKNCTFDASYAILFQNEKVFNRHLQKSPEFL